MADEKANALLPDSVIATALKRFALAADAEKDQRQRELEDLEFEFDPWPDDAKKARSGYKEAGVPVPARPMLNIPMLDQPLQLVINQEKSAHLGIEVHPETEDADDDTAEIDQGIIRHIEVRGRAHIARSWAFERSAKCGRGYYEIRKRYVRPNATGPEAFDQELYHRRILNQFCVYDDPFATEPDKSDRRWLFLVEDLPIDRFKSDYPKSRLAQAMTGGGDFGSIGDASPDWMTDDTIRVARYWEVVTESTTHYALKDGRVGDSGALGAFDEKADVKTKRTRETRTVIERTINCFEVLEEEEIETQYIPVIRVVGREYNIDGKQIFNGIIGPAKDSARLVNFTASEIAQKIAYDVKSPWILAEGQEEGHEAEFVRASARPVAYVRYKPIDINGTVVGPPQRNVAGVDISSDVVAMQQFKEFVHAATFTFDPSLGNLPQKDRSGKAILAQQQQSDSSNSHYLDNLAELSMTYEAKVLLDWIPKVYDRPGRLQEIINGKDERRKILLNQPFYEHPETKKPIALEQDAQGQPIPPAGGLPQGPKGQQVKIQHYDLTKGEYGVTVSVGKSYQTRMQQGSDALGQLLQADPNLMPVIGWRYFQYNDNIPGHDDIANDLKKLRPPQLQDEDGQQPDPRQVQAQMQHAMQIVDHLTKELNAKTEIIKTDQVKYSAQFQIEQLKADLAKALQAMRDAATIEVAKINALTKGVITQGQAEDEAIALDKQLTHEHVQNELDRQHQAGMAAMGAQTSADQSAQDHQEALDAGDQGHQQALEQGEQSHGQALEQADQQATLNPPADDGASA